MRSTRAQQGFTLIELVVVIVILGILAATALPKFVDLSSDAVDAKAKGTAGAFASGATIAYAQKKVSGSTLTLANACNATVLQGTVAGCTPTVSGTCSATLGGTGSCVVQCIDAGATKTATATVPCDG